MKIFEPVGRISVRGRPRMRHISQCESRAGLARESMTRRSRSSRSTFFRHLSTANESVSIIRQHAHIHASGNPIQMPLAAATTPTCAGAVFA